MEDRTTVGDVLVVDGDCDNPYTAAQVSGDDRAALLAAFRDGTDTGTATFWHGPTAGGTRRLTSPDEVDWRTMRS